ncbi:BNI5 (YNL166C) [Zygosaccharomyces parabailii]|nr:BNI5 (YNL166C) [Zygosaccharomyces parabailii]
MGLDKETIEKRVSRIELDIDHMNQMIDENLKLNEAGDTADKATEAIGDEKVEGSELSLKAEGAEPRPDRSSVIVNAEENMAHQGGSMNDVREEVKTEKNFSETVRKAADSFVHGANRKEEMQANEKTSDSNSPLKSIKQGSETSEDASLTRETSLGRFEGGEMAYDAQESPYAGQEVQLTRSEISNDEYYDWSEEQQEQQDGLTSESCPTDQDDPEKTFQADEVLQHGQEDNVGNGQLHQAQLPQTRASSVYGESNDEWEDEPEEFEIEPVSHSGLEDATPNATPHIAQADIMPEQDTPIKDNTYQFSEAQYESQKPQTANTNNLSEIPYEKETQQQKELKAGSDASGNESENETVEFAYKAQPQVGMQYDMQLEKTSNSAQTGIFGSGGSPPEAERIGAGHGAHTQNSNTSNGGFSEHFYDVYDEAQQVDEEPDARSSVAPHPIPSQQRENLYSYSYETFEMVESMPPRTADTSQDSHTSLSSDSIYGESLPNTADTHDSIYIPKNNAKIQRPATTNNTPVASRRPTNPFRVVSVGVVGADGRTSRKTSAGTYSYYKDNHQIDGFAMLQRKLDHLTKKCAKLQKEIDYLSQMNSSSSLPIDDSRKLSRAIAKLQEYFDKKNKEKYEVGVLLSRQLRKEIDRGDNGQFWIGTK